MEKEKVCCEMKAVETAEGFRVEVKGKDAKKILNAWKSGKCCGFAGP